jgi:hypothetical protein
MKLSFTTPCRFLPAHRNPKQTKVVKTENEKNPKTSRFGILCFLIF